MNALSPTQVDKLRRKRKRPLVRPVPPPVAPTVVVDMAPVADAIAEAEGWHIHGILIRSDSDVIPAHGDPDNPPTTILHPLAGVQYGHNWGGANDDASSDISTIDSITFNHLAFGTQSGSGPNAETRACLLDTPSAGSATEVWGSVMQIGSQDLSGKTIALHIAVHSPPYIGAIDSIAPRGFIVGLRSDEAGTPGYRVWHVGAADAKPSPLTQHIVTFEVDEASFVLEDDIANTFDETDVDGILLACKKAPGIDLRVTFSGAHILNTNVIRGGHSTRPGTMQAFVDNLEAPSAFAVVNQGGASSKQYLSYMALQLGNGTDATYHKDENASMEFASPASEASGSIQHNVAAGTNGLTIYASANCVIDLLNEVWVGPQGWPLTYHASTSASADYGSGGTIINADVTLQDVFTAFAGRTYINCEEFTPARWNNADLSGGCTFDGTNGSQIYTVNGATQAALQLKIDNLANCVFKNAAIGLRVEFTGTGAVSLNFDNITGSGNTVDLHYNSTNTSALTAVLQNGSDFSTSSISGSATGVTFSNSKTFTVTSNVSAEITILRTGTQTIEDEVETDTTLAYVFTPPLGFNVDVNVHAAGYISKFEENINLGSVDSSLAVTLDSDPAYVP